MAVTQIITIPNKILTQKSPKIKYIDKDIQETAQNLKDTLAQAKNPEGAGISAPQIGKSIRLVVVKRFLSSPTDPGKVASEDIVLINPKIISTSKETNSDWEACLSVPDTYGKVQRFEKIKVFAQDLLGNKIKIKATGFFARIIQHEIDHLDGILFTSRVKGEVLTEKQLDELLKKEHLETPE